MPVHCTLNAWVTARLHLNAVLQGSFYLYGVMSSSLPSLHVISELLDYILAFKVGVVVLAASGTLLAASWT